MGTKDPSSAAADLVARLKAKPVKARHRVPIESDEGDESRRSRRQTACVQGTISSERLAEPMACAIRNLSATGALVELVKTERKAFTSEERLPDRFTLGFRLESTEVDCEVIWRRGDTLGVRFRSLQRKAKV